jgi:hypothetical protein
MQLLIHSKSKGLSLVLSRIAVATCGPAHLTVAPLDAFYWPELFATAMTEPRTNPSPASKSGGIRSTLNRVPPPSHSHFLPSSSIAMEFSLNSPAAIVALAVALLIVYQCSTLSPLALTR